MAFSVKVSPSIKDLAKEKGVEIREYNIIYKMLEDIAAGEKADVRSFFIEKGIKEADKEVASAVDEKLREEVIYGHCEVRSLFKASKVGQIAGCMVTDGSIKNNSSIRVFRDDNLVLKTHLTSLKRFKDDAKEVLTGFECGLTISDNFNLQEGDVLESFGQEVVKNG